MSKLFHARLDITSGGAFAAGNITGVIANVVDATTEFGAGNLAVGHILIEEQAGFPYAWVVTAVGGVVGLAVNFNIAPAPNSDHSGRNPVELGPEGLISDPDFVPSFGTQSLADGLVMGLIAWKLSNTAAAAPLQGDGNHIIENRANNLKGTAPTWAEISADQHGTATEFSDIDTIDVHYVDDVTKEIWWGPFTGSGASKVPTKNIQKVDRIEPQTYAISQAEATGSSLDTAPTDGNLGTALNAAAALGTPTRAGVNGDILSWPTPNPTNIYQRMKLGAGFTFVNLNPTKNYDNSDVVATVTALADMPTPGQNVAGDPVKDGYVVEAGNMGNFPFKLSNGETVYTQQVKSWSGTEAQFAALAAFHTAENILALGTEWTLLDNTNEDGVMILKAAGWTLKPEGSSTPAEKPWAVFNRAAMGGWDYSVNESLNVSEELQAGDVIPRPANIAAASSPNASGVISFPAGTNITTAAELIAVFAAYDIVSIGDVIAAGIYKFSYYYHAPSDTVHLVRIGGSDTPTDVVLADYDALDNYTGTATRVYVDHVDYFGWFRHRTAALTADAGTVRAAHATKTGFWEREWDKQATVPDWWRVGDTSLVKPIVCDGGKIEAALRVWGINNNAELQLRPRTYVIRQNFQNYQKATIYGNGATITRVDEANTTVVSVSGTDITVTDASIFAQYDNVIFTTGPGHTNNRSTTNATITAIAGNVISVPSYVGTTIQPGDLAVRNVVLGSQPVTDLDKELTLYNCILDGNSANNTTYAWQFNQAFSIPKFHVLHCQIRNMPGEFAFSTRFLCQNCEVTDLQLSLVHVTGNFGGDDYVHVFDNVIRRTNQTANTVSGHSEGCVTLSVRGENLRMEGNTMADLGEAIVAQMDSDDTNLSIRDNTCYGAKYIARQGFGTSAANNRDTIISGNTFVSCGDILLVGGTNLQQGHYLRNVRIVDNTLTNSRIVADKVAGIIIKDNTLDYISGIAGFTDWTDNPTGQASRIQVVDCYAAKITGNTVVGSLTRNVNVDNGIYVWHENNKQKTAGGVDTNVAYMQDVTVSGNTVKWYRGGVMVGAHITANPHVSAHNTICQGWVANDNKIYMHKDPAIINSVNCGMMVDAGVKASGNTVWYAEGAGGNYYGFMVKGVATAAIAAEGGITKFFNNEIVGNGVRSVLYGGTNTGHTSHNILARNNVYSDNPIIMPTTTPIISVDDILLNATLLPGLTGQIILPTGELDENSGQY